MKTFISWSGARSQAVAILLSDWIKCVLQATEPWISTRDIDRGALWFSEIGDQLRDTSVGVICLTQENKNRPWILFEAGALAKGLSSSRVCTFLVDLTPTDIQDPLAQFNHTLPEHDSMWQLMRTLNSSLDSARLDERILLQVFDTYWPQFESKFNIAVEQNQPKDKPAPRTEKDVLSEILENTRSLNSRVRRLESGRSVDQTTVIFPDPNPNRSSYAYVIKVNGIKPNVEAFAETLQSDLKIDSAPQKYSVEIIEFGNDKFRVFIKSKVITRQGLSHLRERSLELAGLCGVVVEDVSVEDLAG